MLSFKIIITIGLITLLNIYVLQTPHLFQAVRGIRLIQGKEIHTILETQAAGPRNLRTIRHVCNCAAYCPNLSMFLVKRTFSRYVRKFLVTTETTKGYTDTFLSFQIFLIFRAKFSYFPIFPAHYYYYYYYYRISHFSALAGKYSPILGCSNQQD